MRMKSANTFKPLLLYKALQMRNWSWVQRVYALHRANVEFRGALSSTLFLLFLYSTNGEQAPHHWDIRWEEFVLLHWVLVHAFYVFCYGLVERVKLCFISTIPTISRHLWQLKMIIHMISTMKEGYVKQWGKFFLNHWPDIFHNISSDVAEVYGLQNLSNCICILV